MSRTLNAAAAARGTMLAQRSVRARNLASVLAHQLNLWHSTFFSHHNKEGGGGGFSLFLQSPPLLMMKSVLGAFIYRNLQWVGSQGRCRYDTALKSRLPQISILFGQRPFTEETRYSQVNSSLPLHRYVLYIEWTCP